MRIELQPKKMSRKVFLWAERGAWWGGQRRKKRAANQVQRIPRRKPNTGGNTSNARGRDRRNENISISSISFLFEFGNDLTKSHRGDLGGTSPTGGTRMLKKVHHVTLDFRGMRTNMVGWRTPKSSRRDLTVFPEKNLNFV